MVPLADLADSWSSIYSGSPVIKSAVAFAHVGALLAGGGMAIAADRATLAAHKFGGDAMRREIDRLGGIHGSVLVSIGIILVSGFLLMFADLDAYLQSRAFWIKMALVAALLVNGAVLRHSGRVAARGDTRAHRTLATAARLSLGLWFATTLAGAVLPNAL
jgi:hypothetical protein